MPQELVDHDIARPTDSLFLVAPAVSRGPSSSPESREADLICRLASGEVAALDAVLARFWSPVVTYALALLGSRDAAEDVAQETFYRLWKRRRALRADGSLRGFIYQVARNLAISEHRRAHTLRLAMSTMAESHVGVVDGEIEDREVHDALERAVRELSQRRREILLLHAVHDLTYREIAALLGIAPQTVANQFSAALASLRQALLPRSMV